MLEIKDLYAAVDGNQILKGVNLTVAAGEIHAIMGPNGAGKSTLAKILAGDPTYEVISGDILWKGASLLELAPEARSHLGLFLSFQYPMEIPGITNLQFLHAALNAQRQSKGVAPMPLDLFEKLLDEKMALVEMKPEFKGRSLNEGFSGGEKKRNEILQMSVLEPSLAILDETDSGLDIDAMKIVAHGVNAMRSPDNALLLITHYQRLLDYIRPHYVHVMCEGKVVCSGGPELALALEERGYAGAKG